MGLNLRNVWWIAGGLLLTNQSLSPWWLYGGSLLQSTHQGPEVALAALEPGTPSFPPLPCTQPSWVSWHWGHCAVVGCPVNYWTLLSSRISDLYPDTSCNILWQPKVVPERSTGGCNSDTPPQWPQWVHVICVSSRCHNKTPQTISFTRGKFTLAHRLEMLHNGQMALCFGSVGGNISMVGVMVEEAHLVVCLGSQRKKGRARVQRSPWRMLQPQPTTGRPPTKSFLLKVSPHSSSTQLGLNF